MVFFKRNKGKVSKKDARSSPSRDSSPQRVGVVSGILTTSATLEGSLPIGGIVDRHFGPNGTRAKLDDAKTTETAQEDGCALPPRHEHLHAVESLLDEALDSPRLEVDPMAHIGHATTITGSLVAEEDLEIQGTIEGSIRLAEHQLTVGSDGLVNASVEAHTVLVLGRISGDVVASELVEIKAGGVIGGDVKSPRVIMHDGGVVIGGLDMSAALPSSARSSQTEEAMPERPRLIRVEPPHDPSKDEGRG
jgi:cytoskeletal protein CcmA (bactofilin family)